MSKSHRPLICCHCNYWRQLPNPEMGMCYYYDDPESGSVQEAKDNAKSCGCTWYNSRCMIGLSESFEMPDNFKWLFKCGTIGEDE